MSYEVEWKENEDLSIYQFLARHLSGLREKQESGGLKEIAGVMSQYTQLRKINSGRSDSTSAH